MMKSERINISLPAELRLAAQQLADEQHYGTVSRLIAQLIKREAERDAGRKRLETLLEQGENSPVVEYEASEFFGRLRDQARKVVS